MKMILRLALVASMLVLGACAGDSNTSGTSNTFSLVGSSS